MPEALLAAAGVTITAQIVTVIIAFFITMFILLKFAWGPIINMIDERRDIIKREFDSIEAKQADLDSKIKDYEERLRQIDSEARERLNSAYDEGKRMAGEVLEEARKASEAMKEKAAADMQLEIEKARVELRDEAVSLTIQATEKLLREELNDERHRKIVSDFITELQEKKAS